MDTIRNKKRIATGKFDPNYDPLPEIKLAQAGDQAARDRVWLRYQYLVTLVSKEYKYPPDFHADVLASGQFGIPDAIELYDPDKGLKFEWYARYHIKKHINLLLEHKFPVKYSQGQWRKKKIIAAIDLDDPHVKGMPSYKKNGRAQEVRDTLSVLHDKDRELFVKYYFDGWTQQELADLEQINRGDVNYRLRKAVKQIKQEFRELNND